jgi:hypothetical protein
VQPKQIADDGRVGPAAERQRLGARGHAELGRQGIFEGGFAPLPLRSAFRRCRKADEHSVILEWGGQKRQASAERVRRIAVQRGMMLRSSG